MPGYGYAKVSNASKKKMDSLLISYINNRPFGLLRCVCVLIDARHGVAKEDQDLFKAIGTTQRTFMIILTKCDKISQKDLTTLQNSLETIEIPKHAKCFPEVIMTSSYSQLGLDRLRGILLMGVHPRHENPMQPHHHQL